MAKKKRRREDAPGSKTQVASAMFGAASMLEVLWKNNLLTDKKAAASLFLHGMRQLADGSGNPEMAANMLAGLIDIYAPEIGEVVLQVIKEWQTQEIEDGQYRFRIFPLKPSDN